MSDDVARQQGSFVCGATEQAVEPKQKFDWEECKENFQPVKDGRKPGVLSNCTSKCTKGVLQPKGVENERRRFVDAIEGYQGPDPLETWLDYIKWTKDTFVSGGAKSELLPLLEKCTREFHKDDRYKDDIRYLRVWIQYADCLPDPSDVFSFLMDHDIGQGHSLFYIAYATFCELTRNYAVADSTYQKGIEKKAVPVDRLEQKFSEFQHRMVRRIQRKATEEQQGRSEENERRGLKTIRGPSSRLAGGKRRNTSSNVGSSSIPVFVDEEFSSASVRKPPSGTMILPSHNESQKENIQAAMPWVGQTIKQKASKKTVRPQETLQIIEDEEFASSAIVDTSGGQEKNKNYLSLRQRFDKDGIEEQLSSDPLKLLRNPPVKEEKPPSPFESEEIDADVTLGTREAYKAMNCLFTGKATSPSPVKESTIPEIEPTMTINTRDALNAVNQMFEASFNVGGDSTKRSQDEDDKEETVYVSSDTAEKEDSQGGFMIREDTVFLSNVNDQEGDDSTGLMVREDTVFISDAVQNGEPGQSPSVSIREDTLFLRDGSESLDIREDTIFISAHTHENGLEEDETERIGGDGLIDGHQGVPENDENAVPEGLVQIPNRDRKHCPLSPLDQDDLIRNEINFECDEEAENALVTFPDVEDEGFTVLSDSNPDQKRINPFDPSFQRAMVESLNPPVHQWPDVHKLTNEEALACENALKGRSVRSQIYIEGVISASIRGKIGSGAYATIFGGLNDEDGSEIALKVEYPPCPWEWFLCKALEGRTSPNTCRMLRPCKMLLSEKFSIIIMEKSKCGTLQDLLNRYLGASLAVDESITAKISLEIFKAMKQLHDSKIIHNDIKPDNIIYDLSGEDNDLHISLIDIGRGVDLELLPVNSVLFGDSDTESFRCVEMRERTPWLWQGDAYAVACTIHCLIFGQYMEVDRVIHESSGESFIRSRSKLPRTYDSDVWEDVFKRLLNLTVSRDCPPDWEYLCQEMTRLLAAGSVAKKLPSELKRLTDLTSST